MNRRGFSLIEVLVAVALMGVVALGFSQMIVQQLQATKALQESMASIETHSSVVKALAKNETCLFALRNPTVLTFNSTLVGPTTPQAMTVSRIPAFADVSSPSVVEVGQAPSAMAASLIVDRIQFLVTSNVGSTFSGEWLVEFRTSTLVRALKPIRIPATISADTGVPTAASVTSCSGTLASAPAGEFGGIYSFHRTFNRCESINPISGACSCPAGFTAHRIIENGRDDGSPEDNQNIFFCYR